MKVRDIMTRKVIVCEAKTSVNEIAKKLVKHDITGMPVVFKEKVIGIVTEADIIMQKAKIHIPDYIQLLDSFLYLEDPKEVEEELKKILGMKAEEIMTANVVTINPDASISDLATLFEEEHINPIPVVKDGKLVGIVSRADIVKLLARE
jgi:CBS domain-containing protein